MPHELANGSAGGALRHIACPCGGPDSDRGVCVGRGLDWDRQVWCGAGVLCAQRQVVCERWSGVPKVRLWCEVRVVWVGLVVVR